MITGFEPVMEQLPSDQKTVTAELLIRIAAAGLAFGLAEGVFKVGGTIKGGLVLGIAIKFFLNHRRVDMIHRENIGYGIQTAGATAAIASIFALTTSLGAVSIAALAGSITTGILSLIRR
jgi:hypothetical protein